MLKDDLERFNEWWFTGEIRRTLAPPFKRYAFDHLRKSLEERQILLMVGMRRVGKTTLLYQLVEKLLEDHRPESILYFSFDEARWNPRDVLEAYERSVLRRPLEECGRTFVFFDEIQYSTGWPAIIKQFYDLYPNLKFFISGSSSLLLARESLEKLAGRFFHFNLKPLTFPEFLEMKGGRIGDLEASPRRMESYFLDYLRKAGFPEIVNWDDERKISEYIRNSVIDRVILRDLPLVLKARDVELSERIIGLILSNPGSILNVNSLAANMGRSRITISNYLKHLELSLLVRALSNFRPSHLASSRKLKKYYPATTSLIYSYSKRIFEEYTGKVLETYVVNALDAKYYFRKGRKEINILLLRDGEVVPVEVKESVNEENLRKFSKLVKGIGGGEGLLISLNQEMEKEQIRVLPAYLIEQKAWSPSNNNPIYY
ncbi:MAG: ATP-binding protein [Candidatus Bathyarchaeia archaeon]|nr:ATP-binding protein [Candidatus Bathyarchaeota archaeon]